MDVTAAQGPDANALQHLSTGGFVFKRGTDDVVAGSFSVNQQIEKDYLFHFQL